MFVVANDCLKRMRHEINQMSSVEHQFLTLHHKEPENVDILSDIGVVFKIPLPQAPPDTEDREVVMGFPIHFKITSLNKDKTRCMDIEVFLSTTTYFPSARNFEKKARELKHVVC